MDSGKVDRDYLITSLMFYITGLIQARYYRFQVKNCLVSDLLNCFFGNMRSHLQNFQSFL